MPWPLALLVTLALLAAIMVSPMPVGWAIVLFSAAWAAYDSTRIEIRRYKTGMALHPFGIFVGVALLWIIGFPWYLIVRGRIKSGALTPKASAAEPLPPA